MCEDAQTDVQPKPSKNYRPWQYLSRVYLSSTSGYFHCGSQQTNWYKGLFLKHIIFQDFHMGLFAFCQKLTCFALRHVLFYLCNLQTAQQPPALVTLFRPSPRCSPTSTGPSLGTWKLYLPWPFNLTSQKLECNRFPKRRPVQMNTHTLSLHICVLDRRPLERFAEEDLSPLSWLATRAVSLCWCLRGGSSTLLNSNLLSGLRPLVS